jgi:hypothetical protein
MRVKKFIDHWLEVELSVLGRLGIMRSLSTILAPRVCVSRVCVCVRVRGKEGWEFSLACCTASAYACVWQSSPRPCYAPTSLGIAVTHKRWEHH